MKHFELLEDGRTALSKSAMGTLRYAMTQAEYAENGQIKLPLTSIERHVIDLLKAYREDGFEVETLT